MNKLVINTANDELYLVLQKQDQVFCAQSQAKVKHNESLLPMLDALLKEQGLTIKDIQELGVVVGPGSFTGIRVGISIIKAFRDVTKAKAKSINNLDYLFELAKKSCKDIDTVAILGSKDSYFVGKYIHDQLYKYERNLSLQELQTVAKGGRVAMFKEDANLNCKVVQNDPGILLSVFDKSKDETLTPVYYQLSQAEREKLNKAIVTIEKATKEDEKAIFEIENSSIKTNVLTQEDISNFLIDANYCVLKACVNKEIAGFAILQFTDESNIVSIAVKKEFRNFGLATKLINQAEIETKNRNLSTISLEVGYKNITAYLLYQKLGFIQRRIRKNYYQDGTDCVEMVKEIK